MYVAENSPAGIRGRLGGFFQLGITFGFIVNYIIGFFGSFLGDQGFRLQYSIIILFSVILFIFSIFSPETSPDKIPNYVPYKKQFKSLFLNFENIKLLIMGVVLVSIMRLTG
jgi:MFS family permease